jgi:hypothetical protein
VVGVKSATGDKSHVVDHASADKPHVVGAGQVAIQHKIQR